MEKVLGIGGAFFKARDPKALAAWYREHLGVPVEPEQTTWNMQWVALRVRVLHTPTPTQTEAEIRFVRLPVFAVSTWGSWDSLDSFIRSPTPHSPVNKTNP